MLRMSVRRISSALSTQEAADEPIVDDLAIADRQQEKCALVGRGGAGRGDEGAEIGPAGMVAAAGKRPAPGEDVAAINRHGRAGRGKAGAAERVVVGGPDLAL